MPVGPERSANAIAMGKDKPAKEKLLRRFRVLSGVHSVTVKDQVTGERRQLLYGPKEKDGVIVETYTDLNRYNQPNSRRYEEIGYEDKRGPATARDGFEVKSKRELLEFIEEENEGMPEAAQLQVDPKWNKHQLIEAMRKHVPAARLAEYEAAKLAGKQDEDGDTGED